MVSMSETIQLEQLLDEKASMEDEGHGLDEEHRQLRDRAKALTAKIIEELRKQNNAKQNAVNGMQSKVNELELQLSGLQETKTPDNADAVMEEATVVPETEEMTDPFVKQPQQGPDETVTVAEAAQEVDVAADSRDKRKRKFF